MKGKNLTNIVTNFNQDTVESWMDFFKTKTDYYIIGQASILGLMMVVLLKKSAKHIHVNIVEHQLIKLGFMNIAANKGGINL